MRTRLMRGKFTLLFIVLGLLLAAPAIAFAQDETGSTTPPGPTITSDKADYAPGELVTLTGSGWVPGESVNINVNDDEGQTWNRNVNVIADPSGNITDQFNLPNTFVAVYSVTATAASGTATTTFTDAALNLYAESARTTERAVFERGDTVYARANGLKNTSSYKLEVRDSTSAAGAVKATSACFPGSTTNIDVDYAIQSSDPLAGSDDWKYNLLEYANSSNCSGTGAIDKTATFRVAKAFAYASPGLASLCVSEAACPPAQTSFSPNTPVFVSVLGFSKLGNRVSTTWIRGGTNGAGGTNACVNSSGNDRPVPDSTTGRLPSGANPTYLQYPPGLSGDTWNIRTNYDATPSCAPLASGDGNWELLLQQQSSAENTVRLDLFNVAQANQAPTITLPGGALSYTENAAPTVIDSGATANDPDSTNFDTGKLTVDYSAGGTADDRLAIRNEGAGAGQIGVSGSNVTFGGTTIGTFTGGSGTTALEITFNANSSPASAQALMRNITYENVSDNPTAARTVRFVLTDGDGGTSNAATKQINVTAVNDAPTVGNITGDATASEGDSKSYTVTATDPDGDTLTYAWTVEAGAATITNGAATNTATVKFLDGLDNVNLQVVVRDNNGGEVTKNLDSNLISVANVAPEVTAAADQNASEGTSNNFNLGSFTDPGDDDPWQVTVDWGDGSTDTTFTVGTAGDLPSKDHTYADDGDYTVTVTVAEAGGSPSDSDSFEASVANVAPVVGALTITDPKNGVACLGGNTVSLGFSFTDAGSADTHKATIAWGDGSTNTVVDPATSPVSGKEHTYSGLGPYTITVTVTDDDTGSGTKTSVQSFHYNIGTTLLSPVNADSSANPSLFKLGSTIPLKVNITDCNGVGVAGLSPDIRMVKTSSNAPLMGENEGTSTQPNDTNWVMRGDGNGQYIYNLASKSLPDPSATYKAQITDHGYSVTTQNWFGIKPK